MDLKGEEPGNLLTEKSVCSGYSSGGCGFRENTHIPAENYELNLKPQEVFP